jgi:hypothetical protein
MVVLSGYNSDIYAPLEDSGWLRKDFDVSCASAIRSKKSGLQGAGAASKKVARTESIWICPKAIAALERQGKLHKGLFD